MFENPRSGRQARNFTTNVPKILVLKTSSEQIFSRKLPLGAPDFGVQTTVNLWVMDKCLIPGGSSIPRYRDLKLELGSEPNPLVRPEPNPLVRDL